MHAALRRLQCAPGKAQEVASLIQQEFVPQLHDVEGVISYTLVLGSEDQVSSLGLFNTDQSARAANELAVAWAKDRLGALGVAPMEAADGPVLIHETFAP
jgi:hypothetical protein